MSDLLEEGANWLAEQRDAHMAASVVYSRDASSVAINATVGRTYFDLEDDTGMANRYESRDFVVLAADLDFGSGPVLPLRGDEVRQTVGGEVWVFQVLSPPNEPVWRWADQYGLQLRVHTKRVDTE